MTDEHVEPELKPCPFCRGAAFVRSTDEWSYAECATCHASTDGYPDEDIATERWNRRALSSASAGICEPGDELRRQCAASGYHDHDGCTCTDDELGKRAALSSAPVPPVDGKVEPVAWKDVLAERRRQVDAEGWTLGHDDAHKFGQLADAACCYAMTEHKYIAISDRYQIWPWEPRWFKPTDRRRDLVKAAALIVAEIERLDRAAKGRLD